MAWAKVPGLNGKVFIPDDIPNRQKKHPCKECHTCLMCSDDRCHVCRLTDTPLQKPVSVCIKTRCTCSQSV